LDLEKVELQTQEEHKQYVLEKFEPTWSHNLLLMMLRKGEEKLQITHPIVKLGASDADQIAAIMKKADPEFWNEIASDQIIEGMNGTNWFGIKVNKELVSIGRTRLTAEIGHGLGHVVTVATHEGHRNKGYATSIVSHSVRLVLDKLPVAVIYVLSDNPSAIRVYTKVGFKTYKTYFFIRGIRARERKASQCECATFKTNT
jgi:ribosomal protein S18 acetylase RimI-like enzyme